MTKIEKWTKPKKKPGSLFHQFHARVDALTVLGTKKRENPDVIRSVGTRQTYLDVGKRFTSWAKTQGKKTLGEISVEDARRWLGERKDAGLSPYTLAAERSALVKVLGYRTEDLPLPRRATTAISRSRGPAQPIAPEDEKLVQFLQASGLRRNEARILERRDIDVIAGTVHVRRGKGGRERTVRLLDAAVLDHLHLDALSPTSKVLSIPRDLDVHRQRRIFAQTLFCRLAGAGYADTRLTKAASKAAASAVAVALGHGAHRLDTVKRHYLT